MICSRCGTPRRPIGPRYSLDGWGRECRRYACRDCGYSWIESTRDQKYPAGVVAFPDRTYLGDRLGREQARPFGDDPGTRSGFEPREQNVVLDVHVFGQILDQLGEAGIEPAP